MLFRDRSEAGRQLAEKLMPYAGRQGVLVLALPRGGVPVGFEVARALHAPLDVFLVQKLGVPGREELALGAIASGGTRVLNDEVLDILRIEPLTIEKITLREQQELKRREQAYRDDGPPLAVRGQTVILVDDGLATGATMEAAVTAVAQLEPREIVVAVPVGARDTCVRLARSANRVVALEAPAAFRAVGAWYDDFTQTTDEEVRQLVDAQSSSFRHDR